MDRQRMTALAIEQWEAGYLSLTTDRIVAGRNSIEHGECTALRVQGSLGFPFNHIQSY